MKPISAAMTTALIEAGINSVPELAQIVVERIKSPIGPRFSHRLHNSTLAACEAHTFRRH